MFIGRFLLRLLVVPLGGCIAICVAMAFVMFAHWNRLAGVNPDNLDSLAAFVMAAPPMAVGAGLMLVPATLGVVVAEIFAIRSWIFHVANGGLSMAVRLASIGGFEKTYDWSDAPLIAVGAGIAAGFAYWAVAGWSAGFWKPVFAPPQRAVEVLPPPAPR